MLNKNHGFVILMVFVVMAIILFAGYQVQRVLVARKQQAALISGAEDREILRQFVKVGLHCPKTMGLNPGNCPAAPTTVAIGRPGASLTPLIATTTTTVGSFVLRATCTGNASKQFKFEYRPTTSADWKDLEVPLTCP